MEHSGLRRGLSPIVAALLLFASCTTLPPQLPHPTPLSDDPPIMSSELVPAERFVAFASAKNAAYGASAWNAVWQAYRDACQAEGVNQAVALVQMLHETNYLRFGGTVKPEQNNFAGLGVTGGGVSGLTFPDVETGALAHVQHLKAYGSTAALTQVSVDPRAKYVKRGSATTLRSLTGKWAADPLYGDKLIRIYRLLWGAEGV